jgi:hypothetical protein
MRNGGADVADEGDKAAYHQQMEIDHGIARRRAEGPQATGRCLYCGEELTTGRRWCDADCRDAHMRETATCSK